ncbi:LOW QUALITY PROTEIN: hypothetical protein MAR_028835 [Mya arenaria]|uniref:Uncharacterized protein n=1 Tax=Mya arenaria TaxID=6604 RepID=A0ABY7DIH8_MYAAR|nr:LOW QUALITY PROTEIN: hypothetical protein MAR_028835 [Mya arenaria]
MDLMNQDWVDKRSGLDGLDESELGGLDESGLDGLDESGLDGLDESGLDMSGPDGSGLVVPGLDESAQDRSGLGGLGLDRSRTAENVQETVANRASRKRKYDPSTWKRNIAKRKKKIWTGICFKQKWKTVPTKIHENFRRLGNINKQRQFIEKYVIQVKKEVKKTSNNDFGYERRKFSIQWQLPTMSGGVERHFGPNGNDRSHKQGNARICTDDNRGHHSNRVNRNSELQKSKVRNHIRSFPNMDSHYCRKDSSKRYLASDLNISKMYRLYCEDCSKDATYNEHPVKHCMYSKKFNSEFNLSFHVPSKDRCDLCSAFNDMNDEEKENNHETYRLHIANKEHARRQKESTKKRVEDGNEDDLVGACFDLEQVLITPKGFESELFYKRRLGTYNFTIYQYGNRQGYCYLWNETISGRGANEVASCLYNFIQKRQVKGKRNSFFSLITVVHKTRTSFTSVRYGTV